jgi:hypothetical protein
MDLLRSSFLKNCPDLIDRFLPAKVDPSEHADLTGLWPFRDRITWGSPEKGDRHIVADKTEFIRCHASKVDALFVEPEALAETWSSPVEGLPSVRVGGMKPRDIWQNAAMVYMKDRKNKIVSLQGRPGTGKTHLALACAHEIGKPIVVVKQPQEWQGAGVGYLKGTLEEKTEPVFQPVKDLWKKMKGGKYISYLPTTFIQGLNLDDCTLIIDEAQCLDRETIRMAISRAGEGTRVFVIGDVGQIRDRANNGLNWLVRYLHKMDGYAHVVLKGEQGRGAAADMIYRSGL